MSKPLRAETIQGTVDHFRALMERLIIRFAPEGWASTNGERLAFTEHRDMRRELVAVEQPQDTTGETLYQVRGVFGGPASPRKHYRTVDVTPPTRGSWEVWARPPEGKETIGHAGIEAYEQQDGTTLVEFRDGYSPRNPGIEHDPIGESFEEFCEMLIEEAKGRTSEQDAIADQFDAIATLAPHPRGRALQRLFADMAEQHGWSQEEGVRTTSEEIDVIINRERDYFLIECKWEKDSVEASVVRDFYGKLSERPVGGLIVSMSGFTSGALDEVKKKAPERSILLFGPIDTCRLMYGRALLDELIDQKYDALVKRSEVVYL